LKKPVSLVLSGGGARGLAHIGVIEELEKQGFDITSISATSMGAVVGGIYAVGELPEFKEWMYTLDRMDVFKLIDFTFSSQGLIKGDRVFKKMKEFIPDTKIENLKINYAATATDILNNKEIVFTKGSLYEAIRASIAIPTVITPVKKDDTILVDGGVMNSIPINHVKRTTDDILIVVYVNADIPVSKPNISEKEQNRKESIYLKKIRKFQDQLHLVHAKSKTEKLGYFDLINRSISLLTNHISKLSLEKYPPDILIEVSHNACGLFDFYKAEELVEIGRYAAVKSLSEYENKINPQP
jgi:NTE family protein